MPPAVALTWNEALSGITGSISLACWVFLLLPQLLENYRQGSAEGISLTFLFIWLLGDVTNLLGALWAGLVPTVIALAVYFTLADVVLIAQCLYYNNLNKSSKEAGNAKETGPHTHANGAPPTDQTPLLAGGTPANPSSPTAHPRRRLTDVTADNMGLPGSHTRRRSSANPASGPGDSAAHASLERIANEQEPTDISLFGRAWLKNTVSILMILVAGTAGWALAWKAGAWRPTPVGVEPGAEEQSTPIGAEVLGYASAVAYLGARIPQIVKNQRERSCEGLSLLFFILSLAGNLTYGMGIMFHSVEREYVMTNLPWLIGSLGTMVEDAIIFVQFSVYGDRKKDEGKGSGDESTVG